MNWQDQLKDAAREGSALRERTDSPSTVTPDQLRAAAVRFDARADEFAAGKGATCRDLAEKLAKFGSFVSEKQAAFAANLVKWSLPREFKADTSRQNKAASALLRCPNLFTVLQKHTSFHLDAFKITRRNQDSLCWIVRGDVCIGKIEDAQATIFGKRAFAAGTTQAEVAALLAELEMNPLAAAIKYGKLSGRCCSCGRDLTDPVSIEAGIGPICAARFQ